MRFVNRVVFATVLAVAAGLSACGKEKAAQSGSNAVATTGCAKSSGSNSGSTAAAALTDCGSPTAATGSGSGPGSASAAHAKGGLFSFCKWAANDNGGCMTCTPRDLDLLRCAKDVKKDFNAAKDCSGDDDKNVLTCEMGGSEDFVWNLSVKSKAESLYEKLPLLIAGGKILLATKLQDNPKKELIISALDIFSNHAKEIFNGQDITATVTDVAALAKKAKPTLTDAELEKVKTQITTVVNGIQTKRRNGAFADADIVTLAASFVTALPPDVVGAGVAGIDMSALSGILTGGPNADILGALAGGGSSSGKTSGSGT